MPSPSSFPRTRRGDPKEAPRFEDIKLIDYDFKTYGDAEKRKALLERWDREIGAVAN